MNVGMGEGGEALLAGAARVAELAAPMAAEIEAGRRLPPPVVGALVEAGIFKMLLPRALGGAEASIEAMIAVLERLARADGSLGWVAMIGGSSALMSAFLPPDVARAVYAPKDAITCGVFAPMGRAVREGGGFRVTGRWPFASGCELAQWRMGGVIVEGDSPLPSGAPNVRSMLFAASEARVIDTWRVSGLCGTGSHDLEVRDVLVPEERSFSLVADRPRREGGVHALPFFGVLAAGVAAVTLGIARAAIDALVALAREKRAQGSRRTLAHRELVQLQVARAEGKVRGARAFLVDAAGEAAREAEAHGEASPRARAVMRVAAAHAASEAASAVDAMYEAGGATSIYATHPLQRHLRDVHVATQHVMVSSTSATLAGRVLLEVESDLSTL